MKLVLSYNNWQDGIKLHSLLNDTEKSLLYQAIGNFLSPGQYSVPEVSQDRGLTIANKVGIIFLGGERGSLHLRKGQMRFSINKEFMRGTPEKLLARR